MGQKCPGVFGNGRYHLITQQQHLGNSILIQKKPKIRCLEKIRMAMALKIQNSVQIGSRCFFSCFIISSAGIWNYSVYEYKFHHFRNICQRNKQLYWNTNIYFRSLVLHGVLFVLRFISNKNKWVYINLLDFTAFMITIKRMLLPCFSPRWIFQEFQPLSASTLSICWN